MLTKDEFAALISRRTGVTPEGLNGTSSLDLGLDSFGLLELAVALGELGVELDERGWLEAETVDDMYDMYRDRAERSPATSGNGDGPAESGSVRAPSWTAAATPAVRSEPEPEPEPDRASVSRFDTPMPPTMDGRFFRLTPVLPPSSPFLYSLSTNPDTGFRWRYRGSIPSYEAFERELWQGMLAQFVVESIQTGQPAGHVICYNPDLALGHAYVGAAMTSQYLGTGIAAEPVRLFLGYLFDVFPLRKLYFEVPEFNYHQFASAGGRVLQIEGRLRDHDFYGGRRWDRLILVAYRPGEAVSGRDGDFTG